MSRAAARRPSLDDPMVEVDRPSTDNERKIYFWVNRDQDGDVTCSTHRTRFTPTWSAYGYWVDRPQKGEAMAAKKKGTRKKTRKKSNGRATEVRLKRKPPGEGMIPVDLDDDEVHRRGEDLAREIRIFENWSKRKAATMRELRKEKEAFEETIEVLADEVNARQEWQEAQSQLPGT